jgi:hypothetical protein
MNESNIVWDEIKKRFRAYLHINGERRFLGYFQSLEDAAISRRQQAYLYVQEFLNYQP